jgi:polyhydroxyalkanoate synthesis repressor PhaR
MPKPPIQITRYPNRRFYARNESKYISLEGIEQLVRAGETVEIRDSQTDEDLTRAVLARIIMERQPEKMRLFPTDMLHCILRSNEVTSDFLRDYFRNALPYLEYLHRHSTAAMSMAQPMHWLKAWLDSVPRPRPAEAETTAADDQAGLAERLAELEARLRQLEGEKPAAAEGDEHVLREPGPQEPSPQEPSPQE